MVERNCLILFRLFIFLLFCGFSSMLWGQNNLFEHYSTKDGLPDDRVYGAVIGPDGQVWFATANGVARFNGLSFSRLGQAEGLNDREILGILKDADGTVWCYSSAGRIFRFKNNHFEGIPANELLARQVGSRIINRIQIDEEGIVWVATVIGGELWRVSPDSETLTPEPLKAEDAFSFYAWELPGGRTLSGTHSNTGNNQLRVVIGDSEQFFNLSKEGGSSKSSFIRLQNGSFLYAKDYELLNIDAKSVLSRVFVEKSVESITEDSFGKIWVALYQGGVMVFSQGGITSGRYVNYLGDRTVTSILEDNTGSYWMTTDGDGAYYLSNRPQPEYQPDLIFSKPSDANDSVNSTPITANPPAFDPLSGSSRVISITANDSIPPVVDISGVRIMGKEMPVETRYELDYNENFIRIQYAGFSYANPELVQYKYQLKGVDEAWVYTSSTSVQYTTLPPGKYTFTVLAMNKEGTWSDQPGHIEFFIRPPFYATWWFLSLLIGGGILLIGGSVWTWSRSVKRKERDRVDINRRIASIELKALRAQMNPHFIFNTLSSIQHFITTNDSEAALKYLSKFAKLMRRIMDNSKMSTIPVTDELKALELYLELEVMRFKSKFSYQIIVDSNVDSHYDAIPSMLIQPYVENAILHGFMNKKTPGHLTITLRRQNNLLEVVVDDDGIGRKRSQEINQTRKGGHHSQGLSITQERLEILNASNQSDLSVTIEDKYDHHQEPAGTRVQIFVPLAVS